MSFLDRDTRASAMLATFLAASALVMLLVHGHAPVAAAHLHLDPVESAADLDAEATSASVGSPQLPGVVDQALGSGSWAVRDGDGPTDVVGLLALAVLGLAGLAVVTRDGATARSTRRHDGQRTRGSTPVLRHEVIRV